MARSVFHLIALAGGFLATYPLRHWQGRLPLLVTGGLNCLGLTAGLWVLAPELARQWGFAALDTPGRFTAGLVLSVLQFGLVPLWQMVGLWRCCSRLVAGGRVVAGRVGQVGAVLFTLAVAMGALVTAAQQLIGARVAYALGPYAYQVTLLPGGREIEVRGGLGFGVAADLEALLGRHRTVRRVRLNSGGGALVEAQRLRAVIQAHGLDTITTTGCSSACVSAFVGGRFRYLQRGAPMGVHLPRHWQPLAQGPLSPAFAAELGYLKQRGLPDWFIAGWIRTGPEFWFPGETLLRRSGIVTAIRGAPRRSPPAGDSSALTAG